MIATEISNEFYVIGGTLRTDARSYVRRRGDDVLYAALRQGRFCYLLTSRQMGKSSLMVRTAQRLRESGSAVVVLDLTAVGQNLSVEQWYEGLIGLMGQQLDLEYELEEYWFAHERLAPLQRWRRTLLTFLLPRLRQPLVIFVDEIDAVRSLAFSTDEFFAAIREFYNQRTTNPDLARLTFCLLGVATPSDLIRDTRTTPFNIGERIKLRDFTEAEAAPLMYGLTQHTNDLQLGHALLKRVLHWTGGHPYLTQRLCQAVAQARATKIADVDRLNEELFLSPRARERDDNLLFVRERLLRSEADLVSLLELYDKVRRGKKVKDDETNPLVSILRLSGIVIAKQGLLKVRNQIYAQVFDGQWVADHLPNAELERQRRAFRRGQLRTAALAAAIILFLSASFAITREARQRAEALLYIAQMNLAQQAWESGNTARVLDLLKTPEELRNFEWNHLWQLTHQFEQEWKLEAPITALALSPDGQWLAAGHDNGSLQLLRTDGTFAPKNWKAHQGSINSLSFAPDGTRLASGGDDNTVYLWTVTNQQPLARFTGHNDSVHTVLWTRAETGAELLLSGSEDGALRWWDVTKQQPLHSETTDSDYPILAMALAPNGKTLALASLSGDIALWDATLRQPVRTLSMPNAATGIRCLQFSPDSTALAANSESGYAAVWSTADWQMRWSAQASRKALTSLTFSPDNQSLALGGVERRMWLADAHSGKLSEGLNGFADIVTGLLFTPDGQQIFSGSRDQNLRRWKLNRVPVIADYDTNLTSLDAVAFAPAQSDGATGLAMGGERGIQVWRLTTEGIATVWQKETPFVIALAWSDDGKHIATASEENGVSLWDAQSGEQKAEWLKEVKDLQLTALAFSPTEPLLVAGGTAGENSQHLLYLLNGQTGQVIAQSNEHKEPITCIAFRPDGRTVATGSRDGRIVFWNAQSLQKTGEITVPHQSPVLALAFDPQGEKLAGAGEKMGVMLWNAATYQSTQQLLGHAHHVTSLQFTADGRRLVTASKDQTIKLWDTATWQEVVTYQIPDGEPRALALTPQSHTLAVGTDNGRIKLWRKPSLQPSR